MHIRENFMQQKGGVNNQFVYGYGAISSATKKAPYSLVDRQLSNKLTAVINKLDTLPTGSRVLNLGCGDGVLERHTKSTRRYNFTSIDLEPAAIHTIQTIFRDTKKMSDQAIVGDITDIESIKAIRQQHYNAVVSWRVLHGIHPVNYTTIFKSVRNRIAKNSSFFVAVACDQDWKAKALDEKLSLSGVNDCAPVMFDKYGIERQNAFPVHFFTAQEIIALGNATGFEAVTVDLFEEPSGYQHLKDKKNSYLFVEFIAK